jgi:hypothetical protein
MRRYLLVALVGAVVLTLTVLGMVNDAPWIR